MYKINGPDKLMPYLSLEEDKNTGINYIGLLGWF